MKEQEGSPYPSSNALVPVHFPGVEAIRSRLFADGFIITSFASLVLFFRSEKGFVFQCTVLMQYTKLYNLPLFGRLGF